MNNFSYWSYTDVRFGRGVESKAGNMLKKYGKKALLHYGGGSIKKSGLYDSALILRRGGGAARYREI